MKITIDEVASSDILKDAVEHERNRFVEFLKSIGCTEEEIDLLVKEAESKTLSMAKDMSKEHDKWMMKQILRSING